MRRPGYANVVATLALVVAMGGTSYAAVKITGKDVKNSSLTGKDVKNESLTGKDLKKQSVPLDRLSGSLPRELDPGSVRPVHGSLHRLRGALVPGRRTVPSWCEPATPVGGRRRWRVPSSGTATVMLDPALPTTIAGRAMRLRAVDGVLGRHAEPRHLDHRPCLSRRISKDAGGNLTNAVELEDENDHTEKTCKRYEFTSPVILASNSRVSLHMSVGWTSEPALIALGGATFELDRA